MGGIVPVTMPAVTEHLYLQGASAVVTGQVDPALLAGEPLSVTADGCAKVAGLPIAQVRACVRACVWKCVCVDEAHVLD
jgi:hypothetical protein